MTDTAGLRAAYDRFLGTASSSADFVHLPLHTAQIEALAGA